MLVPNRHHSYEHIDYRYGFQGQEKDDELKGKGNSINYTFRMHDPRVGRFFAVDPLEKEYPFYSPYAFSGNRVLDAKEIEGKEPGYEFGLWLSILWTKAKLSLTNSKERIMDPVTQNNESINNNILISEERKQDLYQVDAFVASADLSAKILATSAVATVATVGGGVAIAELGALPAAGSLISTEFGYLASSGPLWSTYFSSQFTFQGILETSKYNMAVNGSTNLFGQLAANDFKFDENINLAQPIFAGITRGTFSNLGESSFNFNYDNKKGFSLSGNSFSTFIGSYFSNSLGGKMSVKFEGFTKPITDFSSSIKPIFDIYGGSTIEVIENGIGKEIENKLNEQFSSQKKDKP